MKIKPKRTFGDLVSSGLALIAGIAWGLAQVRKGKLKRWSKRV